MKFLFVGPGYPGAAGCSDGSGIGTYLFEIIHGLSARGHQCDVLVWGEPNAPSPQQIGAARVFVMSRTQLPIVERIWPESGNVLARASEVSRLDSAHRYDWIEIQHDEGIDIRVQKRFPKKTIVRLHTPLAFMVIHKEVEQTRRTRCYLQREVRALRHAPRVVVSSDEHRRRLLEVFPFRSDLRVVHLGVDVPEAMAAESRPAPRETPNVLVVGTFDRRKAYDRLAPIVQRLVSQIGRCTLTMVSNVTAEQVQRLGLTDCGGLADIRLRSQLTRAELMGEYRSCSVFLHLARYESFGLPLIEAAAFGLPIVATATGIAPALLEGELKDFVVDGDDPVSCADAIARAIRSPHIGNALRRRYLDRFTREQMISQYLSTLADRDKRFVPTLPKPYALSPR